MASTLAAQLQKIAATSTNTLNTQKLKSIHSASLLFPPAHAATQDLDTIFSITTEGFQELCLLDDRFIVFEKGLFSDGSKDVDRFLLTAEEVAELDRNIDAFLQLVSGRMLLRPALKAVEWLVRRFRVQEQNTASLILCFLPYHAHPTLLPTLLRILAPKDIPREFLFVAPYIKSDTLIPRHVITHAISHRRDLFSLLTSHTVSAVRSRRDNHALVAFFSTIMTESVSLMCDSTTAASTKRRKGGLTGDDVLQRTLAILDEGYKARKSPEFQTGCYMLTTIIVSKLTLEGQLLQSLMQSVVKGWGAESAKSGLACLAFLAQALGPDGVQVSDEVVQELVKVEGLTGKLLAMGEKYRVDKLVVVLCLGILDGLGKRYGVDELSTVIGLLEESKMGLKQRVLVMKRLVGVALKLGDTEAMEDIKEKLAEHLVRWAALGNDKRMGKLITQALEAGGVDVEMLELKLQTVIRPAKLAIAGIPEATAATTLPTAPLSMGGGPLESYLDFLSELSPRVSFLEPRPPSIPEVLTAAVMRAVKEGKTEKIIDLAAFRDLPPANALEISMFVRFWTSPEFPAIVRSAALRMCREVIKERSSQTPGIDYQALIPYILVGLADPSSTRVRLEAAELGIALHKIYRVMDPAAGDGTKKKKKKNRKQAVPVNGYWGFQTIYGETPQTQNVKWLEIADAIAVTNALFNGSTNECVLDSGCIGRAVGLALSSGKSSTALKGSLKTSALAFLSSHAVNVPLLEIKLRLLAMLNNVERVAPTSRTQYLIPALEDWVSSDDYRERREQCALERVDIAAIEEQMVRIVSGGGDKTKGPTLLVDILTKDFSDTLKEFAATRLIKIWDTLDQNEKLDFSERLLEIALDQGAHSSPSEAARIFGEVEVSTAAFESFFEKSHTILKAVLSGTTSGAVKRRRTANGAVPNEAEMEKLAAALKRTTSISELLEAQDASRHPNLLKALFGVLADVSSFEYSGIAYLTGVVLECMKAIVRSYKGSQTAKLDGSVRADVLVNCIRSTPVPQVQGSALLLLADLADVAPEIVKHSVMPIFTFMGANTLRQDDEYSAHVIEQTIHRIIPPLVKSLQEKGGNPVVGAADLVTTFVASYKHIPVHRRVRLFIALTNTLGAKKFLFTLIAKLGEKYGAEPDASGGKAKANLHEFCATLVGSFGVEIQLETIVQYLRVVMDVLEPDEDGLAGHLFESSKGASPTQLAQRLLYLLAAVLESRALAISVTKCLSRADKEADKLSRKFSDALEMTLALGERYGDDGEVQPGVAKVLEQQLGLLNTPQFVNVIEQLIGKPGSGFRRSALKTFKDRLAEEYKSDYFSLGAILGFLPKIAELVSVDEPDGLAADALTCINAVTIKYGSREKGVVSRLADAVVGPGGLRNPDDGIRALSLVCLTSMASCLGGRMVPILPKSVPYALELLEESVREDTAHELIHNAVVSFLEELARNVPLFMGSYLQKILPLMYASAECAGVEGKVQKETRMRFLRAVGERMKLEVVLGAYVQTWGFAVNEGLEAVEEAILTIGIAIDNSKSVALQRIDNLLLQFMLLSLDIRGNKKFDAEDAILLEAQTLKIIVRLVHKLNDTIFKPIFLRLFEWATEDLKGADVDLTDKRSIAFWNMLAALTDGLKSVFTDYYGYVLDNAVEILSRGSDAFDQDPTLWEAVLKCLRLGFADDTHDFWQSPTHFDKIAPPILSQLTLAALHADDSVEQYVTPAIVELANAVQASEDHAKFINSRLLGHMRDEDFRVRLAAVEALTQVHVRLGEDWLSLLPESVPVIAELMEDGEEDVENAIQRLIKAIEEHLGEGELENMLA